MYHAVDLREGGPRLSLDTFKSLARLFAWLVLALVALTEFWLYVSQTPDTWLLWAIIAVAAIVVALTWGVRAAIPRIQTVVERYRTYGTLQDELNRSTSDRDRLSAELASAAAMAEAARQEGIQEGAQRIHGVLAADPGDALPRLRQVVVRNDIPTVFATPGPTSKREVGARYTLVVEVDHEKLGVLQVTAAEDDTLTLLAVDEIARRWWRALRERSATDLSVPDGVTLAPYDPVSDHPERSHGSIE